MIAWVLLAALTEPVLLAEDVVSMVPADPVTVLYVDGTGQGWSRNVLTGENRPWAPSRDPSHWGWENNGFISLEARSPDGRYILMTRSASVPEGYGWPEGMEGMRTPTLVMVCSPDGSDVRLLTLTVEVGGGPSFAFTGDSRFLVGSPMFACEPTPAGYTLCADGGEGLFNAPFANRVDLADGAFHLDEDLPVSDGFWPCPYSDAFRVENNWYAVHAFSDLSRGGITGTFTVPGERNALLHGWVLPDGLLMTTPGKQGILRTDGTFFPAPSTGWDVKAWLPDGRYLFSTDDGASWLLGTVDWETFTPGPDSVPVRLPELAYRGVPLPGEPCSGVLFHDPWGDRRLWFLPAP